MKDVANMKKLARQVNMDAAQFRGSAAVVEAVISQPGGFARAVNNGQLADFVRCASRLDDSAEKLAGAVLSAD